MVSVHIWLSIYTNNAILCIIWNFDLSSRGVLGRIYALSIEVLSDLYIFLYSWYGLLFWYGFLVLKRWFMFLLYKESLEHFHIK